MCLMSSSIGNMVKITTFGQSHSKGIGVVIDGLPAGIKFDLDKVKAFMKRRSPGQNLLSTQRKEADVVEIISGLVEGVTCGAPICGVITNTDARSFDYDKLLDVPRPMHADFPATVKYNGANDIRGGGQFSGRLTAPLCFAGALAIELLEQRGIFIGAHILSIAEENDSCFDAVSVCEKDLKTVISKEFPTLDDNAGVAMQAVIQQARLDQDSVGGVIECAVTGIPVGVGEPIYDSIESRISALIFGIPAVKGIEFGAGFSATKLRGSEHNDPFIVEGDSVITSTNNHGGILGGISTGMPILFKTAFKPTPSISKTQQTVSLSQRKAVELSVGGRHDPCVVLRAVPCVEAAAAIAILDLLIEKDGRKQWI